MSAKLSERLYEPAAYSETSGRESFWSTTAEATEYPCLTADRHADVVIIGAGYAGLNCALQLSTAHQRSVVVLDARWPGWGASGRNGGFCCIGGGKLPQQAVTKKWGQQAAQEFAHTQRHAIDHVRQLLQQGIDAEPTGQGELCLAHSRRAAQQFEAEAEQIRRLQGVEAQVWSAAEACERGAKMQACYGGMYNPLGFGLNPWQYISGLASKCTAAGVDIYANSPAVRLNAEAGGWRVHTPTGTVRAKKLVVATNGYSSDNLPSWLAGRYLPVLSSILVTRPMSDSEYRSQGFSTDIMSYDSRTLLHYFRRLQDGRFLLGTRGAISSSEKGDARIKRKIKRDFKRMFPAWSDVEHSYYWSGLVCLTGSLQPFVGPIPDCHQAYAAFGWHGNGVAMASYSGKLLADVVADTQPATSICAPMRSTPSKMPLGKNRRALLWPAYVAASLADNFL